MRDLRSAHDLTADPSPETTDARRLLVSAIYKARLSYCIGVPDSGLAALLAGLKPGLSVRFAPREDVAVAAAVGAYLGGLRPLVFMKNAGLGTSLDALMSLARAGRIPIVLLIGWAGTGADTLPHHVVMGDRTAALLDAAGISRRRVIDATPDSLAEFIAGAFVAREIRAILVSP